MSENSPGYIKMLALMEDCGMYIEQNDFKNRLLIKIHGTDFESIGEFRNEGDVHIYNTGAYPVEIQALLPDEPQEFENSRVTVYEFNLFLANLKKVAESEKVNSKHAALAVILAQHTASLSEFSGGNRYTFQQALHLLQERKYGLLELRKMHSWGFTSKDVLALEEDLPFSYTEALYAPNAHWVTGQSNRARS